MNHKMNKNLEVLVLVVFLVAISISMTGADYHEIKVFVGDPNVMLLGAGTLKESLKGKIPLEKIPPEKRDELACVIVRRGDKYFWKSREGYEVARQRMPDGDIMFRRLDRPDYVRIVMDATRDNPLSAMMNRDHYHHYVEHITLGLISVNYWGRVVTETEDNR